MSDWYALEADAKHISKEREKARKLRKSQWWKNKIQTGICYYCEQKFKPAELTMDHLVPLARGGKSSHGNIVAACKACNAKKKLDTPADQALRELKK